MDLPTAPGARPGACLLPVGELPIFPVEGSSSVRSPGDPVGREQSQPGFAREPDRAEDGGNRTGDGECG